MDSLFPEAQGLPQQSEARADRRSPGTLLLLHPPHSCFDDELCTSSLVGRLTYIPMTAEGLPQQGQARAHRRVCDAPPPLL